jgi:predicted nucleic acid-binding protein
MDGLIAAIAVVHGAALATRDIGDFADLGLQIINPFDARPNS